MWKCTLLILAVVAIVIMLSAANNTSTESYSNNKFKFVSPTPQDPETNRGHGIDNGCFPEFPRQLYSTHHSIYLGKKLEKMNQCSNCVQVERYIVEQGKIFIRCLHDSLNCQIPDLANITTKCETCKLLVKTWSRYFDNVKAIVDFLKTGNLPSLPADSSKDCKNCGDTQEKCKNYAEKVRDETNAKIHNKDYTLVQAPDHTYKGKNNCCWEIYKKWTIYTFKLMTIGNYVECARKQG